MSPGNLLTWRLRERDGRRYRRNSRRHRPCLVWACLIPRRRVDAENCTCPLRSGQGKWMGAMVPMERSGLPFIQKGHCAYQKRNTNAMRDFTYGTLNRCHLGPNLQ
jgi:hypothetical protein